MVEWNVTPATENTPASNRDPDATIIAEVERVSTLPVGSGNGPIVELRLRIDGQNDPNQLATLVGLLSASQGGTFEISVRQH